MKSGDLGNIIQRHLSGGEPLEYCKLPHWPIPVLAHTRRYLSHPTVLTLPVGLTLKGITAMQMNLKSSPYPSSSGEKRKVKKSQSNKLPLKQSPMRLLPCRHLYSLHHSSVRFSAQMKRKMILRYQPPPLEGSPHDNSPLPHNPLRLQSLPSAMVTYR